MKQGSVTVHCIYAQTERSVEDIILESFRAYLQRILALSEKSAVQIRR